MANSWNATAAALTGTASNVHEVDPVSRIEGHLGIKVVVNSASSIVDANAHGNLWRGFENFLLGRAANDAITFVQRICGVCPVPHGMTSTYAVDTVLGYSEGHITFETGPGIGNAAATFGIPAKAVLIRNLVLSAEFLMSSITHFYHLAAPSYIQGPNIPPWTPYFADEYYHSALLSTQTNATGALSGIVPDYSSGLHVWDAIIVSYLRALKMRRMTFEAAALFAGRMPMTSCYVGGGVTTDGTEDLTSKCDKFIELIRIVGEFIVEEYVPIALTLGALYKPFDNTFNTGTGYGAGLGRFLSWGAFPNVGTASSTTLGLPGGFYDNTYTSGASQQWKVETRADVYNKFVKDTTATTGTSVPHNLTEDIAWSRYDKYADDASKYTGTAAYPGDITRTKPKRSNGYTYMKAPRWNGEACEVGPFARLVVGGKYPVDGRPLASVVPGYGIYVHTGGGLDAGMLAATVANGLVNSALVSSVVGGNATGTVPTWILGLKGGLSTMDRLRARALESLVLVQAMVGSIDKTSDGTWHWNDDGWAQTLKTKTGGVLDTARSTWSDKAIPLGAGIKGWGGTEAPRGALMHQMTISNGKITAYQCIVPTTWNGSPKDSLGNNGAIEKACIGAPFRVGGVYTKTITGQASASIPTVGGVEVLRIAQSFDPCIACAVH